MVQNSKTNLPAPIIILSAPRAGSTLLFETLVKHPEVWSIGGESHALIEHIPELSTVKRGFKSNCLNQHDATSEIQTSLKQRFLSAARNNAGELYTQSVGAIRLLEKTPKNALRVAFFDTVFPDAKFVYLVRDPRENVSSIMQAWRSNRFVTYPNLPGWKGNWSLLLPEGWQNLIGQPLASVARFQWQSANDSILQSLSVVPDNRKMIVCYSDLIKNPANELASILSFCNLDTHCVSSMLQGGLSLSRYTLSAPKPNKWHANASLMASEMPQLKSTVENINRCLEARGKQPIKYKIEPRLQQLKSTPVVNTTLSSSGANVSRNAPCPCGSGKKYRQCHGQLR